MICQCTNRKIWGNCGPIVSKFRKSLFLSRQTFVRGFTRWSRERVRTVSDLLTWGVHWSCHRGLPLQVCVFDPPERGRDRGSGTRREVWDDDGRLKSSRGKCGVNVTSINGRKGYCRHGAHYLRGETVRTLPSEKSATLLIGYLVPGIMAYVERRSTQLGVGRGK